MTRVQQDDPTQPAVLVADDDDAIRELVATVLLDEGYRVQTAPNGRDALSIARHEQPDVVLLDVNMPLLDGLSACRLLRDDSRTAALPVVIMSARPLAQQELRRCRVSQFLPKPFNILDLVGAVQRCAPTPTSA